MLILKPILTSTPKSVNGHPTAIHLRPKNPNQSTIPKTHIFQTQAKLHSSSHQNN